MTHEPPTADQTITEIVERLGARFPSHPTSTIRDVVTEAYDELSDAHVRDFVEVLVERQAKKRLKHLDMATTSPATERPQSDISGAIDD